jgi:glutamate-5-semialdehyde dehydrogenase
MQSEDLGRIVRKAKEACLALRKLSSIEKDRILRKMAQALIQKTNLITRANKKDLRYAKKHKKPSSFIDRLSLDSKRIRKMAQCLREIAELPDPVGEIESSWQRPNGLQIKKVRVPIGVIGVIYESRPNVTSDCIGLCLKAGNALVLRGGSFAFNSNLALFNILVKIAQECGLPEGAIGMIKTRERKAVKQLLKQDKYIDLIIPRGGETLIKEVTKNSRIPVIKHYKGLCHIYVDEFADLNMAHKIVVNAKVQRPGVCNAVETLLVHEDIAGRFLPVLAARLKEERVQIRGCRDTLKILKGAKKAKISDWRTEYLDKIISIKIVLSLDEAVQHINKYSSGLSEVIVTDSVARARTFLADVDSAAVYLNASSRFTDGNQFGLGAEIGISTDKIHARGPMSVRELTSYKYVVLGNGQIRQ